MQIMLPFFNSSPCFTLNLINVPGIGDLTVFASTPVSVCPTSGKRFERHSYFLYFNSSIKIVIYYLNGVSIFIKCVKAVIFEEELKNIINKVCDF